MRPAACCETAPRRREFAVLALEFGERTIPAVARINVDDDHAGLGAGRDRDAGIRPLRPPRVDRRGLRRRPVLPLLQERPPVPAPQPAPRPPPQPLRLRPPPVRRPAAPCHHRPRRAPGWRARRRPIATPSLPGTTGAAMGGDLRPTIATTSRSTRRSARR